MSNIYNLEPQAHGVILLKTTFGDIEVELFTKQCPKNTKNFVQLCLDGYYDGTLFDRVEKDFIAIGGELDLNGVESLETELAPDEFHSRLKFSRRGLLATANTEKNANGPKFFFTLGPAPELQNKHTIFGRVRGDSVYHLVDLNDCNVDEDLLPISEKRIIQVIVKENPYPELGVRSEFRKSLSELRKSNRDTNDDDDEDGDFMDASSEYLEPKYDFKNAKKLSFYEESDDDDDDDDGAGDDDEGKGEISESKSKESVRADDKPSSVGHEQATEKTGRSSQAANDSEPEAGSNLTETARERKLREIREQIRSIKRKLENESAVRLKESSVGDRASLEPRSSSHKTEDSSSPSSKRSTIVDADLTWSSRGVRLTTKKGLERERETIELVQHFKKRLKGASKSEPSRSHTRPNLKRTGEEDMMQYFDEDDDIQQALDLVVGDDWLHHRFDAKDDPAGSMAKDANTKSDDWYSIDDPRNPMAQRVELDRARDYKRHKERDRHRDDLDEREHRPKHRHHHHHR